MYVFDELTEMLEKELKNIVKQDDITPQSLECAGKAVDILKDIETIEAMRGGNSYSYDDMGMSGARMRGSYNYSGARSYARGRDSRGRYTSRGYSYHDEADRMIAKLEEMSDMTSDPTTRRAIEQCISKLEG